MLGSRRPMGSTFWRKPIDFGRSVMADKRRPYRRHMPEGYKGPEGPVTFMAAADGYVMVRRPGCLPFVVPVRDWNEWEEIV